MTIYRNYFFILAVIVLGLVLRFWGAPSSFYWTSDIARDFLVGSHILHYREYPIVGQTAAGFGESFFYPPYTYYLIAVLQNMFPTPELLIGFFVFFHSMSIILFIYAAYLVFGWPIALISGIFMTLSAKMIYLSRLMLVSPGLPILYASAIFGIYAIKKQSLRLLFVSIFFILYASMFHYSAVLYIGFLWVLWCVFLKKKTLIHIGMPLIVACSVFFLLLTPLIYYFGLREVLKHFMPGNNFGTEFSYLWLNFIQHFGAYWKMLFPKDPVLGFVIMVIVAIMNMQKTKNNYLMKTVFLLCSFLFLAVGIMALMKAEVTENFFVYVFPVFFIICGVIFVGAWQRIKNSVINKIFYGFMVSLFIYALSGRFAYMTEYQPLSFHQSIEITKRIKEFIDERSKTDPLFTNSFQVYVSGYKSPVWGTSTIMYYLEQLTHRKLVHIINNHTSIAQDNSDRYIIIACRYLTPNLLEAGDWHTTQNEWNTKVCLENFVNKFPVYKTYTVTEIPDGRIYDAQLYLLSRNGL